MDTYQYSIESGAF